MPKRGSRLMERLGYPLMWRKAAIGVHLFHDAMAEHAPPGLLGIHVNIPGTVPADIGKAIKAGGPPPAGLSADELRAYEQLNRLRTKHYGYAIEMGTARKHYTGLADTPVGLAAWMIDHDGRSCGQISAPF